MSDPHSIELAAVGAPEEHFDLPFLIWLVGRTASQLLDTALAPSGLTSDEFAIYSVLGSQAVVTPGELSRWMAAPASTVTSHIRRFEARGHVERERDPGDRRSLRLRLTPSGHAARAEAEVLFRGVRSEMSAALGDEEARVSAALQTLRTALDRLR